MIGFEVRVGLQGIFFQPQFSCIGGLGAEAKTPGAWPPWFGGFGGMAPGWVEPPGARSEVRRGCWISVGAW